ncbi:uncharacterized protein LOC130823304 [Amaranthus tricolor]|uniref:uncharacterized protein LOC130823304 n=1 Tax=Amaranthus tricolor TaxID=29722 RepID=UPI002586AEA7|nr:uncharacterized protein LOC130823304 [Amaranthus tricolor]
MRFGKKAKLSPKFIGPYEVIEKVGKVAYRLALPNELGKVHNVFHISQLKRYVFDKSHVLDPEPLDLDENLSYEEKPIKILDSKVHSTRRKGIKMVKVLWPNKRTQEATWETEDSMREKYLTFFLRFVSYGVVNDYECSERNMYEYLDSVSIIVSIRSRSLS